MGVILAGDKSCFGICFFGIFVSTDKDAKLY